MKNIKIPILISKINKFQRKYFEESIKSFDIDSTQGLILTRIKEYGSVTSKELVSLGVVEKPAVSKNIKKLEKLGYIIKRESEKDARSFSIELSPSGEEITDKIKILVDNVDSLFKKFLSDTTLKEMQNLLEHLEKKV
nr:MarR family winged helix-turn-helix transcriptional regulator [uncultured Cetobacterium sp.]